MEISWADVLGNVPIAVAILVAWLYMDRNRTALEREREKNRGDDERATNDRLKDLIALQNQSVLLQQQGNDRMAEWSAAIRATAASMRMLEDDVCGLRTNLETHNTTVLGALKPIGENVAAARASSRAAQDAIGRLEVGQQNLMAGLERLLELVEARGQTDDKVLNQVESLASRVVGLNEVIDGLRGELATAVNGPA